MRLRTGFVFAMLMTGIMALPARAGLVLEVDGPFSVAAGHNLTIPVYVSDDGLGGPTTLTDFTLQVQINANAAAAPDGLQFLSGMSTAYAGDSNYVFATVTDGPTINVDPSPPVVGPYQGVTITDLDNTFNGVLLTGKQLIAELVLTTLPSLNSSGASPAQPMDKFTLSFEIGSSEYNFGDGTFSVSGSNDGSITVTAVPEPGTIYLSMAGLTMILVARSKSR